MSFLFVVLPFFVSVLLSPAFAALTFTDSNWIWSSVPSPPIAPAGVNAFRKTFATPVGKTLQSATILVTGDNLFTLFVNAKKVGAAPNTVDIWKQAKQFTTPLSGSSTIFAVRVENLADPETGGDNPAGLLVSIQISFSDGTTASVVSDTTWKVHSVVDGFELASTDDSAWSQAVSFGKYGLGPWGTSVVLPKINDTSPLIFSHSFWIWDRVSSPPMAEAGTLGFRKTLSAPSGKSFVAARVLGTGDNLATFYVNGEQVYTVPNTTDAWKVAFQLSSQLRGTSTVFAARVLNLADSTNGGPNPAGFLASLRVSFSDGSIQDIVSDTTWKVGPAAPGFELPSTDDSKWHQAVSFGQFGVAPWNNDVSIPSSTQTNPSSLTSPPPISIPNPFSATKASLSTTDTSLSALPTESNSAKSTANSKLPLGPILGVVFGCLTVMSL